MTVELHVDLDGQIAEILLNAPAGNSLDRDGIESLTRILADVADRSAVRCVIISGAGETFCSGRIRDRSRTTEVEIAGDLQPILDCNDALDRARVPVIAAVEGAALGFGFGLSIQSDLAIASRDARFALTELAHGIPPLIVLSYLFRFLPYKVAFELALSGREIDASEALRLGLVTEVVPAGGALDRAREQARVIAQLDPEAVGLLRRFSRESASLNDPELAASGASRIAALLAASALHEQH